MVQVSVEMRAMADAAYEALNSGDLEAFLALTAEDVEFTSMVAEAEAATFRGHVGVRTWWHTVRGAFQSPRWEELDMSGAGERVVAKLRVTAMLGDGELAQTMWLGASLREGKLGWLGFFRDEHEAREAVGLSE